MKIPNKKIFAYIKKYDKLDFGDVRDNRSFNKFKVGNINSFISHLVKSTSSIRRYSGFIFCYLTKIVKNNNDNNIYYGVLNGYFICNPKLFYTTFQDYINENGYTYLLSSNRFVVEFKKKLFIQDT